MEDELYRQYILELYHNPLNAGELPNADITAEAKNPTCGDELTLMLELDGDGKITAVAHKSHGCAISQASISLLTDEMEGKTVEELQKYTQEDIKRLLGIPISHTRDKCAGLPLRAINKLK